MVLVAGVYSSVERSCDHLVEMFHIPEPIVGRFCERTMLYREGVILMRLIAHSQDDSRFSEVQCAYEAILIGQSPTSRGIRQLMHLKSAMTDLQTLVRSEQVSQNIAWAQRWFRTIGHDEPNPVANFELAMVWTEEVIGTSKAIKECLATLP